MLHVLGAWSLSSQMVHLPQAGFSAAHSPPHLQTLCCLPSFQGPGYRCGEGSGQVCPHTESQGGCPRCLRGSILALQVSLCPRESSIK